MTSYSAPLADGTEEQAAGIGAPDGDQARKLVEVVEGAARDDAGGSGVAGVGLPPSTSIGVCEASNPHVLGPVGA